jgi:glycosyltransferase involved in cell wall biosynthesis
MKRVLIEMEKLKNPNSGLGQFCLNLGEQFQKICSDDIQLDYYLPAFQKNIFGDKANYVKHTPLHKLLPMSGSEYDVWHCLQQDSHYLPTSKKTKLILTIHDLNFLEKYKGSKQKRKLNHLQKKADKASVITVISKFTETMVREFLNVGDKPIQVITNGNSLKVFENATKPDFVNCDEFLFSIGVLSPRKNFHVLLPLLQHHKNLHLIIAGDKDTVYAKEILATAQKMGIINRLHLVGIISDEQKYWLYKHCKAFVFPSLVEGFGLPMVEAMSLGKPVFASSLGSLPEVGGEHAFYWKNFDAQHMIELFDSGIKSYTAENAVGTIDWANQFSWENAAKAYLKIYQTI